MPMSININADSLEELKKLSGILNSADMTNTINEPMSDSEDSSCGCGDIESEMPSDNPMKDILAKMRDIDGAENVKIVGEEDQIEEEWANSTDHFDGEEREMEQPSGEIVDTSLRRHLGAKGSHVTVDESGHTMQSMTESYEKFKGEDEEKVEELKEEDEDDTETDEEKVEESASFIYTLKMMAGIK